MWCYSLIGRISQLFLALTRNRPVLQQKDEREINGENLLNGKKKAKHYCLAKKVFSERNQRLITTAR